MLNRSKNSRSGPANELQIWPATRSKIRSGLRIARLLHLIRDRANYTTFHQQKHINAKMGREGVTLTHWRKNAEETVPGELWKKIRGRPGESGGLNGSGES